VSRMWALRYSLRKITLKPLFWALFISAAAHLAFFGPMNAEKAGVAGKPVTARLITRNMHESGVAGDSGADPAFHGGNTYDTEHATALGKRDSAPSPAGHEIPSEKRGMSVSPARLEYYKVGYPYLSRKLGEEGDVVVSAVISKAGVAESVEVVESSGYKRLDNAVRTGVEKAVFIPKKVNGQAVSAVVLLGPFKFRLNNEAVEKY